MIYCLILPLESRLCAHRQRSRACTFAARRRAGRAYLQIVESRREGDQVRQQVIATLGRYEDLKASGQLERLLRSGARFAEQAMVLGALDDDTAARIATRRIGPALVFERLWEETGCRAVIEELAGGRKHGFALERAVFLDRAAPAVRRRLRSCGGIAGGRTTAVAGTDGLDLHHLYRGDGRGWAKNCRPRSRTAARHLRRAA